MTEQIVSDVFSKLSKLSEFKYTEKKLYYFLNKSDFQKRIDEQQDKLNISPYTIFIKEQLSKGVKLNDVLDLWNKTKNNKSKLELYENKYKQQLYNLSNDED